MIRTARIVSDGTPYGTQVLVDDEPLGGVTEVSWTISHNTVGKAVLTLDFVPVDVVGEIEEEEFDESRRD